MEANAGKSFQMQIFFNIFPRISLHCKLVPVQYWEYEYGLLKDVCCKLAYGTGHIGINGGVDVRMYVRTVDDVTTIKPRFLALMGYHIFLTTVLRTRAFGNKHIKCCSQSDLFEHFFI